MACLQVALALACGPAQAHQDPGRIAFCCRADNDLYRVVCANGVPCVRAGSPEEAVRKAAPGGGLLILADGYPERVTTVAASALSAARAKKLRVLVEFPGALPGMDLGEARATQWERAVVSSGFFGAPLSEGRILAIHGCGFVPLRVSDGRVHIAIGRVAGYDRAVFGLPEESWPALVEIADRDLMIATTGLSSFVRGRYGPSSAWGPIWRQILSWLAPGVPVPELRYTPAVRPSYGPDETLPADVELDTFERGVNWYYGSRLLVHKSWLPHLAPSFSRGVEDGPMPPDYLPIGDGSQGLLEGFSAQVAPDGSQRQRFVLRNDCLGESAMALAFSARVAGDARSARVSRDLADFICFDSLIHQGVRADPRHPSFGLMAWGITSYAWERAFYGDDNARAMLGLIATGALLDSERWDESVLEALLANLRTTGPLGFRGDRIDIPDLEANGWKAYGDRQIVNPSPHYESYLWACYLWAYRATGYREFLDKAESAIRLTMEAYPDNWRLTYGLTLDRSRMLLCLAWLVRVHDTAEHREWLTRVASDLLRYLDASGALREVLGDLDKPQPSAVPSNEAYGTAETPLIQENGDPACDMLYSMNFAFLGLHEAVAATGDPTLAAAEDLIARFLCRIQVHSEAHPELDGAWFRSFDYDKWDYWGSSADIGWGAWSIESGWTQAWITSVLALRRMGTSLWDLTSTSRMRGHLDSVLAEMSLTPPGPYVPHPEPVESIATGAPCELVEQSDERYPGTEADLTDGRGWPACAHGKWRGWWGRPLCATVDLGAVRDITAAGARFLQSPDIGIFLPTEVRLSVSGDGREFRQVGSVTLDPIVPGDRGKLVKLVLVPAGERARYVRIAADPQPAIPAWHFAGGKQAWLFTDEVVIR